MTITVLIADDQAMVRAGFAAILDAQDDISVVGQAADGAEAIELARRLRPDLVLMDVRMPNVNGIEATRELVHPSRGEPHTPLVLVLTTFDVDDYVHDALTAGASGFLLKDALPEDLVQAVRIVAAGDALHRSARGETPPRAVRGAATAQQQARPRARRPHRPRARDPRADGARSVERRDRR